jgi:Tfp pilus assembly protein FimT
MSALINSIALGQSIIPYRKELREICGSATAVLLFSQLLYWFEKNDYQEFYKFISPCQNQAYKEGDSWTEELGFSYEEFSTAFSKIGEKFVSKTKFEEGFENEKMFYSYTDKIKGLTYWGINKNLIEKNLSEVYENSKLPNLGKSNYVNRESQITELGNVKVDLKQKTTTVEYTEDSLSTQPAKEISKLEILKQEIQANPLYPKIISLYPKISSERLETEIEFALTKFIELGRTSGAFSYIKSYLSNADFKDVLTNKKLEIEDEINSRRKTAYEQKTSQNSSQNTTTNQIEVDPDDFQTQNDFAKFTQKLDAEGKSYKVLRINFTRQRIWDEATEKPTVATQPQKSEAKSPMEILMESMRKTNPKLAGQMERGAKNPFVNIAQKLAQN